MTECDASHRPSLSGRTLCRPNQRMLGPSWQTSKKYRHNSLRNGERGNGGVNWYGQTLMCSRMRASSSHRCRETAVAFMSMWHARRDLSARCSGASPTATPRLPWSLPCTQRSLLLAAGGTSSQPLRPSQRRGTSSGGGSSRRHVTATGGGPLSPNQGLGGTRPRPKPWLAVLPLERRICSVVRNTSGVVLG